MRVAIQFFDEGKDSEAMDGFMDILVHGDPSERGMANDYLNLITQRMNTPASGAAASSSPAAVQPPAGRSAETRVSTEEERPAPAPARAGAPAREPVKQAGPEEASSTSREAMRREIEAKVRARAGIYLSALRGNAAIRVVMADQSNPRAVALPASLLFGQGLEFRKRSLGILRDLTGLVYCLGGAQVTVYPEGALTGESSIPDMRRATGISSLLYSAGISPARVRVNLLQSQADIPRALSNFRGIVLVFAYDQSPALTGGVERGGEGPPVSLGVSPDEFYGDRDEGSIIEFSVMDSPAGLRSWRFQLLAPEKGAPVGLVPVQEVTGGSPVFHQIYWNGRKGFFGSLLPPGKYEISLTAADANGRSKTVRRWVTLKQAEIGRSSPEGGTVSSASSRRAPVELRRAHRKRRVSASRMRKRRRPSKRHARARKHRRKAVAAARAPVQPQPAGVAIPQTPAQSQSIPAGAAAQSSAAAQPSPAAPAAGQSSGPRPDAAKLPGAGAPVAPAADSAKPKQQDDALQSERAVSYKIMFQANTSDLTPDGERQLSYVADAMTYYPQESLSLIGYASSSEPNAQALAEARAKQVSNALVNKYGVDSRRIGMRFKSMESAKPEVDIYSYVRKE